MIKTNFIINCDDVRKMCIENDFCTKCDCKQYEQLLNMCDFELKSFETLKKRLIQIANLIYCYSNVDDDFFDIETIMIYLMNECVKTFFEIN